ncbi:helix-turn-helix domain-containing protein [Deinococcus pimensis]|uniref:helix-turn-helix domain-containing protein n=1 Tax=Deinococcus pimensis TaxID=309888 RepID=UPI0009FF2594
MSKVSDIPPDNARTFLEAGRTASAPTVLPSPLLTVVQAGHYLQLSRNRVYELCRSGAIPSVRIGGSIRIPLAALEKQVTSSLNNPD